MPALRQVLHGLTLIAEGSWHFSWGFPAGLVLNTALSRTFFSGAVAIITFVYILPEAFETLYTFLHILLTASIFHLKISYNL